MYNLYLTKLFYFSEALSYHIMSSKTLPLIARNFSRILTRNFSSTLLHRHPVLYSKPKAITANSNIPHNIQLRLLFGKKKNENEEKTTTEENEPLEEANTETEKETEKMDDKIEKLEEILAGKDEELKESKKKYLYSLAEMDNMRKVLNQQMKETKLFAIQNFTKDLLSTADTLESAVKSVKSAELEEGGENFKNFFEGVKMTESNLQKTFSNHGLERIDPLGEKFNPAYHESAFLMPGDVPGTVGDVRTVGYLLNGRLLRPSLVGVIQEESK